LSIRSSPIGLQSRIATLRWLNCGGIYRMTYPSRDPRWQAVLRPLPPDEAAFDLHAKLPQTVRFVTQVRTLIDHPMDVNRTHALD